MTDDACVWATQLVNRAIYIHSVRAHGMADRRQFHDGYHKMRPLDPGNRPSFLVSEKPPIPRTDLFAIQNKVMVVSERLARLLATFDLGSQPTAEDPAPRCAELHPMPLLAKDEATKIRDVALLQVSNHKDGWVPEESRGIKYHEKWDYYSVTACRESLAVRRSALTGPDLWRDFRALDVLFLSDRLYRAMAETGIERLDGIHPCRMLDG